MVKSLDKVVQRADDRAVREAAKFALSRLKANLNYTGPHAPVGQLGRRTGRLFRQARIKFFRSRGQLRGAALRVIGDRAFVMKFAERGTQTHGRYGGPLIPRKVFELTWRAIHRQTADIYQNSYDRAFKSALIGLR